MRFPVAVGLVESLYEYHKAELSYVLAVIFKSLLFVAHRFLGRISKEANKSFLPPWGDLVSLLWEESSKCLLMFSNSLFSVVR